MANLALIHQDSFRDLLELGVKAVMRMCLRNAPVFPDDVLDQAEENIVRSDSSWHTLQRSSSSGVVPSQEIM